MSVRIRSTVSTRLPATLKTTLAMNVIERFSSIQLSQEGDPLMAVMARIE